MGEHQDTSPPLAARLSGRTGRAFWRNLDELAGTEEFAAALREELPSAARFAGEFNRRSLLQAMAASLALAGLTGEAAHADETALPYVEQPDGEVAGVARWYATAVTLGGYAAPMLGKTYAGRPVTLEGNPDHPATGGATDPFQLAALLGLYDAEHSPAPRWLGRPAAWSGFDAALAAKVNALDRTQGEGLRLLTGTITSPTLARQIAALLARWPKARWHVFEPLEEDRHAAAVWVFGRPFDIHLRLDRAEAVVSLDADILGPGPWQSLHGRRWSERRRGFQKGDGASRLLVAEAVPSLTGLMAEERLIIAEARMGALLHAIAAQLGVDGATPPPLSERESQWVNRAVTVLHGHPGRALLVIGATHPTALQALALLVNERLGAHGTTLTFSEPVAVGPPDGQRSLERLVEDVAASEVSTLVLLAVDPVYAAPVDLDFRAALKAVPFRLHAGLHFDETAALCHWHAPLAHELESWSDARAPDGTASLIQPLIRPFRSVRSAHSLLANLTGSFGVADRELVKETWRAQWGTAFESRWRSALLQGFIEQSAPADVLPTIIQREVSPLVQAPPPEGSAEALCVAFRPDPTIWDGRFANNAWLQETPKPFSKMTWGNVIAVSPQVAARQGLSNGDEVTLSLGGRSITGAAWVMPGQQADTIALTFGYGQRRGISEGLGYNAFALRTGAQPWRGTGASIAKTGARRTLATTQAHQAMDGFGFVRTVAAGDAAISGRARAPAAGEPRAPSF